MTQRWRERAWCALAAVLSTSSAFASGSEALAAERSEVPSLASATPTYTTLDNGTQVVLLTHSEVPLVSVVALVAPGSLADPAGKEGLTDLVTSMLRKGAGTRSAEAFADALDGLGAQLSSSTDHEATGLYAEGLAADTDALLDLLRDAIITPSFDDHELEKLKSQKIDAIRLDKSDPRGVIRRYFQSFVYGDHPYGRPPTGDENTLASIEKSDVVAHHAAHFGSDRLILVATGDFEVPRMREALNARFGGWRRALAVAPTAPDPGDSPPRRVLLVDSPESTQTYFILGGLGVTAHYPRQEALDIAHTLFGGRFTSMLNSALRIESGLTYGARAIVTQPKARGWSGIYSYTETPRTADAVNLALGVLDRLHTSGFTAEQIASAKANIRGQFPVRYETASQWAGALGELALLGEPPERITGYLQRLSNATSADVAEATRDAFPLQTSLVTVLIGDRSKIESFAAQLGTVTHVKLDAPGFGAP